MPSELRTVGVRPAQAHSCGRPEAGDVADLGDHQHRDVAADAADLAEHLDVVVVLGERVDLAGGQRDLAVEVSDQTEQALEAPARRVA